MLKRTFAGVMKYLTDYINEFIYLFGEMAPWLLLGFIFAGILHVFMPEGLVVKYMGGKSIKSAIYAALLGIPLGVYVLVNVPESAVKLVLAALVISFAVYNLTRPRMTKLESNVPGIGFGFVAGILGGAYNTIGPPMVIFGTLRHWPPQRFRITLQAVFFPTSLVVAGFHSANKLWTPLVVKSFIVAIPFLVLAAFVGREINRRFEGAKFSRYIFYLLLVIGAVLIGTIVRDACT